MCLQKFHAAGPAYESARSPNFVRSRGVTKREEVADRRPERDELLATVWTQSARYAGHLPVCTECIMVQLGTMVPSW